MAKETRQIGSFTAVDDSGNAHTLTVYQDFIESRDLDGGTSERPGLPWLCTDDGEHVNCLSKGEYEIVATGLRLHSSEPDAV